MVKRRQLHYQVFYILPGKKKKIGQLFSDVCHSTRYKHAMEMPLRHEDEGEPCNFGGITRLIKRLIVEKRKRKKGVREKTGLFD